MSGTPSVSSTENFSYIDPFIQWMREDQTSRVGKLAVLTITGLTYLFSMNFLITRYVTSNILGRIGTLGAVCLPLFLTAWAVLRADKLNKPVDAHKTQPAVKAPEYDAEKRSREIQAVKKILEENQVKYDELPELHPLPLDDKILASMSALTMRTTDKEGSPIVLFQVFDAYRDVPYKEETTTRYVLILNLSPSNFGVRLAGGDPTRSKLYEKSNPDHVADLFENTFTAHGRFSLPGI